MKNEIEVVSGCLIVVSTIIMVDAVIKYWYEPYQYGSMQTIILSVFLIVIGALAFIRRMGEKYVLR